MLIPDENTSIAEIVVLVFLYLIIIFWCLGIAFPYKCGG